MPPKSSSSKRNRGARVGVTQLPTGAPRGGGAEIAGTLPSKLIEWTLSDRTKTVGQKRLGFATVSKQVVKVTVNCYPTTIQSQVIHQYDVAIDPSNLPREVNLKLIDILVGREPGIFETKVGYDGRKILVSPKRLPLVPPESSKATPSESKKDKEETQSFWVPLPSTRTGDDTPKLFHVTLTRVSEVNLESLEIFVLGDSRTNESITGITALNIALRMGPNLSLPFKAGSFLIEALGTEHIGGGIELMRGLFQSLRPGIERTFVNVDITSVMVYPRGTLLELCIDALDLPDGSHFRLTPGHRQFQRDIIERVERFISGVRVTVRTTGDRKRTVRGLTLEAAESITFNNNGVTMSVAQYFLNLNFPLNYPKVICAKIGDRAIVPLEHCNIIPFQLIHKQVPPNKTDQFVRFARKKPADRFDLIQRGIQHLGYTKSEYLKSFGMSVDTKNRLTINARMLPAPRLQHGTGSNEISTVPFQGAWNMYNRKVYQSCGPIKHSLLVVFATQRELNMAACTTMIAALKREAGNMGMQLDSPAVHYLEPNLAQIPTQLWNLAKDYLATKNSPPQLFIVVLPNDGDEIRLVVKYFGTFQGPGIATQCIKVGKCRDARPQYWANVLLQINGKLGGINSIPDPKLPASMADVQVPTIVMGADVAHPSPGPEGPPSFAALVWSTDPNHMKYRARDSMQLGREEIIQELKSLAKEGLQDFDKVRGVYPKRIIFFRDGVSEGHFRKVKETEMAWLKEALTELGITGCKITYIIVGKRHHIRIHALDEANRDKKSENAPAGTVIDTVITHPVEHDFYLLSHGGIIGTSRPSHYSILHDDNNFAADQIQQMSYSFCHGYASATRSVSSPIPVYYADKACEYAKFRFPPRRYVFPQDGTQTHAAWFNQLKADFDARPLSPYAKNNMYFC